MRHLALAAAVAALAVGCAARQELPLPSAVSGPVPQAAELVRALAARRAAIHSVRALARTSFTSPEESRRAKQVIVAARPDKLRLEVLSVFGAVFVLVTDDGELTAYAPEEKAVYRGAATAGNLARYAQVDMPVTTAVDLLLGTPPMRDDRDGVVSRDGAAVQLWQDAGRDVRVVWFNAALEPVRYEQRDTDGFVQLRATFDGYADVDGVRLPTQLGFELPATQRQITIALRDPEVNPTLPNAIFAVESPPGVREIDLDQEVH